MPSTEAKDRATLAWLLGSLSIEQFQNDYFERRPLHVSRNVPGFYDEYFSLAEYERVLFGSVITTKDLRPVKDGTEARPETYVTKKTRIRRDQSFRPAKSSSPISFLRSLPTAARSFSTVWTGSHPPSQRCAGNWSVSGAATSSPIST